MVGDIVMGAIMAGFRKWMPALPTYNTQSTTPASTPQPALRIALIGYRSHPHVGGQGIYIKQLACALHALANSMIRKDRAHFKSATTYRDELLGTYDKLKNSNSISVPVPNGALEGLKIAKIRFGKFGDEEQVHVAVDPMLLLLKAAVVLSARFGERLLPACPPEANDWDSADEAMAQAYLEQERSRWVAPNVIQVAAGNCEDIGSLSD